MIKDQLDKGIIKGVDQSEKVQPCNQIHHLPHHCVVREDKSATKLLIVYNASAGENGLALNDCLHTGPPLTPDVPYILVRFRVKPIALVLDIEKDFLMIALKKEDRDVLRFLSVDAVNSAEPKIVEYRFARVVVGVTSRPLSFECNSPQARNSYNREDPEFVDRMLCSLHVDDEFKP